MNGQRPPIREWSPEDRPRERFLTKGAEALSDAECLALLLGSGVPGQSALDQAQALLAAFGSIAAVADREVQELAWVGGLGIAKAVRLGAAIELSRRLRARPNGGRVRLSSPEEVAGYFGPALEGKKKEVFRVALPESPADCRFVAGSRGLVAAGLRVVGVSSRSTAALSPGRRWP
jgi:DNA repair protein RadC